MTDVLVSEELEAPRAPRLRGRASDSAATRQQIVEAAARLFSARGYLASSLSDIAQVTDLTKGAVYWHFRSKEDLAVHIIDQMYQQWPAKLAAVVEAHDDALDALVAVTYEVAHEFVHSPITQAGKRLLAELPAEVLDRLPVPYVGWEKTLAELLAQGQAAGQVSTRVDPAATARTIVAAFFGMQQVSSELTARKDLTSRLDDFWTLVRPVLESAELE